MDLLYIYYMERTLNYVQKTGSLKTAGNFFPLKSENREPATDSHFPVPYIVFQAKVLCIF